MTATHPETEESRQGDGGKKTRYTPGPWRADGNFITNDQQTGNHGFATVCELDDCKERAEVNANAQLISKAPEMAELLQSWLEQERDSHEDFCMDGPEDCLFCATAAVLNGINEEYV